ncbi:MAG: hypothetical protein WC430_03725 [Patescibacteria group bacterium]
MEQKKYTTVIMAAIIIVIIAGIIYIWRGQKLITPDTTNHNTNLTACGDFPRSSNDGGPTSRYFVCRNINTGNCYYKTSYFEQINGCDPKFSGDNPYGNEECFQSLVDVYNFSGTLLEKGKDGYQAEDNCANTTQQYFEAKIKK